MLSSHASLPVIIAYRNIFVKQSTVSLSVIKNFPNNTLFRPIPETDFRAMWSTNKKSQGALLDFLTILTARNQYKSASHYQGTKVPNSLS